MTPIANHASCAWRCSWTLSAKDKAAQYRAVRRFVDDRQAALSCVTPERLSFAQYHQSDRLHSVWLADDAAPVPLRGAFRLGLAVALGYHVVRDAGVAGGWTLSTARYIYEIVDAQGDSLFEFHWHPDGSSRVGTPHLHIRPTLKVGEGSLDLYRAVTKSHIPTGHLSLEQVIRFLLPEVEVEPLRKNWEAVLQATEARHREWRAPS